MHEMTATEVMMRQEEHNINVLKPWVARLETLLIKPLIIHTFNMLWYEYYATVELEKYIQKCIKSM